MCKKLELRFIIGVVHKLRQHFFAKIWPPSPHISNHQQFQNTPLPHISNHQHFDTPSPLKSADVIYGRPLMLIKISLTIGYVFPSKLKVVYLWIQVALFRVNIPKWFHFGNHFDIFTWNSTTWIHKYTTFSLEGNTFLLMPGLRLRGTGSVSPAGEVIFWKKR